LFKNLKLNTKLVGGFSITVLIAVIVGIIGWTSVNRLKWNINDFANTQIPGYSSILKLNGALSEIKAAERSLLIPNLPKEDVDNQLKYILAAWQTIPECLKTYDSITKVTKEKVLWDNFKASLDQWKQKNQIFMDMIQNYLNNKDSKQYNQALDYNLGELSDSLQKNSALLDQLVLLNIELVDQSVKDANRAVILSTTLTLIVVVIGGLIALSFGFFISLSISRPMNSAVSRLNEGAQQVAAASNQLSASAQQLSQGSAEQASSIEETSSTLQETSSMLQQNTANTKQAAQLSEQAKEYSNKGSNEMQDMMNSIQEIKKSSDQIAKIIKVIDDIAFQTNILALNAAIEAARAGEAGLGFAVVAEEVRNLAGRSAQAAKDTTAIIETNIELSTKGVEVAQRVADALNEITVQAKKVNELMDEIAAASQEQSQGVEQVNMGMSQMETVTQQNTANAEESASASEELSAQADNLRKIVQDLSQLVNGKSADLQLEMKYARQEQFDLPQHGQTSKLINTKNDSNQGLLQDKKTKVVSPEDVIPLENDPHQF
jgi:methyl-accepting chemotaxis protein